MLDPCPSQGLAVLLERQGYESGPRCRPSSEHVTPTLNFNPRSWLEYVNQEGPTRSQHFEGTRMRESILGQMWVSKKVTSKVMNRKDLNGSLD